MPEHLKSGEHQGALMAFVRRLNFTVPIDARERETGMDVDTLPQISTVKPTSLSDTTVEHLQEVAETVDVLAFAIDALSGDTQRLVQHLSELMIKVNDLDRNSEGLKSSVEEQSASIHGLQPTQEILSQDITSIQQNIQDIRHVSKDGTLVWKISDFAVKLSTSSLFDSVTD
jgi:uncharacterized protein YoxC